MRGKLNDLDAPPDIKQILINMFMSFGTDFPQQFVLCTNMNVAPADGNHRSALHPDHAAPEAADLERRAQENQGYGVIRTMTT